VSTTTVPLAVFPLKVAVTVHVPYAGILSVQVPFDVPVTVVLPQVAVTVEPVVAVTVIVG
jgi:hypothetical protein